jgi:replication initiation protein RepC
MLTAVNRRRFPAGGKVLSREHIMEILTTTPFGPRPVTDALLQQARAARARSPLPRSDKWGLFRELCTGRAAFGLSDRDLTVLAALLSFHPSPDLEDDGALIVFPSNAALSERAHGMAESTLRRHLAALVRAGVVARHDSPNGKRYAARDRDGQIARAFGFDLRPLLLRADEAARAAQAAREAQDRARRLREEITVLKRDAIKLSDYGAEAAPAPAWEELRARLLELHRRSRRKADIAALKALKADIEALLADIRARIEVDDTAKSGNMDANDGDSGRHYQNSKPDSFCFEHCHEDGMAGGGAGECADAGAAPGPEQPPGLPLALVVKACRDIGDYAPDGIRRWDDLCRAADFVRGMMGISPDAWARAIAVMGHPTAAITLACILQRVEHIRSPGGYLRCLTGKAADGGFSPGPMVMALLQAPGGVDSCQQGQKRASAGSC